MITFGAPLDDELLDEVELAELLVEADEILDISESVQAEINHTENKARKNL